MSVCTFLASDVPLEAFSPSQNYPIAVNPDTGSIEDGGADDCYFLNAFETVQDYTDRKYGVCLEWNYTDGRATQLMEYIKNILQDTDAVEFWHVWLMDYYEFEDRPYVHRKTISIDELTTADIKAIDDAEIWNKPDKNYPERPSFYCLSIIR